MPNIIEILARAQSLMNETALNSITPPRAGGIMYDTLLVLNQMQLEGASLLISKVYASVSAMEADTTPTSDLTGRALKPGQIVVIVTSDTSSSDMGSEYRFNGPGSWTYVGKVGGLPLDSEPTQGSTKGITSGAVFQTKKELEEPIDQLEAEVGDIGERTANLDADEEDALFVTDSDSNIIAKIDKDGIETTSVRTKQTNPFFYKDKVFITDEVGNVIVAIDSNGIKTTKIEAANVLKNDWLGKKVATYGDSVTAVNNGDFVPPFVITQNNWGNRVADYFNFGGQIGRGIGSTCFMWRGTSGGQVAWCKTATGDYVNRNDSYTYDNYEGHVTIPADCTPIRGDGCSWLRIVTMFPATIKDTIDAVLVMFHNDYHQDMDTAVEWIPGSSTDPEWAASDEYSALGGDYNIGTVQGGIASVVMKLQAWMPQARIILMTPISGVYATDDGLDGNFDNTQSALMRKLASVVADIASRMSVPLIDNYGRDGINSLNRTAYIYDNIHPYTAKGSKALAASVIGQMKTILPAL